MRINVHSNGGYAPGGFDSNGGEVNGPLQLNVSPTEPLHATSKQYVDNSITTHSQDTGLHLKSKDRQLLDGITVGFAEINRLNGVASNVQDQLNSKLALTGGTINGALKVISSSTDPYDVVTKSTLDGAIGNFSETINASLSTKASLTGTETLTGKTLDSPVSTGLIQDNGSVSSAFRDVVGVDIDCSTGNYFIKTITGNTAFTFSNAPTTRAYAFTLELTITSGIPSWPATVVWPGNTAPALSTGKTHLLTFVTRNGTTRWRGVPNTNYTT